MAAEEKLVVIISTEGQVALPSAIGKRRKWGAGTRLLVEDTPEGVLLKPAPAFTTTRPEDVFGSLPHRGRPKTLEEMDARSVRTALKP
ncbi:MAG: AbrB family transcriptional regulator [Mesorhizobium sp.]|uniref:AbrB/MazE/SpoVT family DNA-binding domain-containing protein n=1 Tax=Mesorhizobium sp. TaxID=1871066 RepID=UPI00120E4068|nr:AbrB/MazE/SpoVT family DNA-binding domain-containing protein [Mesorhizobium sp.]TIO07165.1 MAG: AbrB family transcriptional regulator [Mesorhizobium sp.]TIP10460.1 MAG: AbrB family transcriptional regulator [Mesorhizobium sp.]